MMLDTIDVIQMHFNVSTNKKLKVITMVKITVAAITVSALVVLGMTAFSQGNDTDTNQASVSEQDQSSSVGLQQNARQAYIDPNTGKLSSTPPASPVTKSDNFTLPNINEIKQVQMIKHSGAMVQANLNGNGWSSLHVSLDCDGNVVADHVKKTTSDNADCQVEK